jgi:hypothetical protein
VIPCVPNHNLYMHIRAYPSGRRVKLILSLYRGVFNLLKITTTTKNDIVCISFDSKSAHSNPPIYIYAERGQS